MVRALYESFNNLSYQRLVYRVVYLHETNN
jgi:hypothetical protein